MSEKADLIYELTKKMDLEVKQIQKDLTEIKIIIAEEKGQQKIRKHFASWVLGILGGVLSSGLIIFLKILSK